MKKEFALKSHLSSSLDLEGTKRKCDAYASALSAMGGLEPNTYAAAAAKLPPKRAKLDNKPPPTTGKAPFPLPSPPQGCSHHNSHDEGLLEVPTMPPETPI